MFKKTLTVFILTILLSLNTHTFTGMASVQYFKEQNQVVQQGTKRLSPSGEVEIMLLQQPPKQISVTVPMVIEAWVLPSYTEDGYNKVALADNYYIINESKPGMEVDIQLDRIRIEKEQQSQWNIVTQEQAKNETSNPRTLALILGQQELHLGENIIDGNLVPDSQYIRAQTSPGADASQMGKFLLKLQGVTGKAFFGKEQIEEDELYHSAASADFRVTYVISPASASTP